MLTRSVDTLKRGTEEYQGRWGGVPNTDDIGVETGVSWWFLDLAPRSPLAPSWPDQSVTVPKLSKSIELISRARPVLNILHSMDGVVTYLIRRVIIK